MPELRLDQVEAAFAATPGTVDSTNTPTLDLMPLDQLELFDNDQEIDRKSYDIWYEKALEGMTNANIPGTDWAAEPVAGLLGYVPDITNKVVFGVTGALGNFIEGFSSKEAFTKNVASLTAAALSAEMPTVFPSPFRDPTALDTDKEFTPRPGANAAEKLGKNLRAISFYGYANTKAFQQQLATNADYPLLSQVGGAFGSISTSALLASINPQLAMWAIGGHVGANQYLEQVSRGVDWIPSLGFGAVVGAGVSALEQMSISILFKKYSSRLALAGDAAIVNAVEEFSQSLFESGAEQLVGAEDRTLGEIMKNASFEAALGFIGGGAAGATTIQFAYNRMDKSLKKAGLAKPERHQIIMKSIADGSSILETVLRQGLGVNQDDLDIVNKISSGQMNATEGLAELNKRIIQRQKAKGIDTYLDSDPDALISEQQRIDAAEELAARSQKKGVPLTPDEQAEVDAPQGVVTPAEAVAEAANILSNFDPGGVFEDMDGVRRVVPGGFPEPLANKGYSTRDVDAVVKKVREGKALTERQTALYKDLITLYQDATGRTVGEAQQGKGEIAEDSKKPYEMTREEFKNTPIIKYIEERLKDKENPLTVAERDQLGNQLVDQGLMTIDDFNAMTGKHGFGGGVSGVTNLSTGKPIPSKNVEGDTGKLLNYISNWQTFRNVPLFAHRDSIVKALVDGKEVPKNVVDEYADWKFLDKDGYQVSLKEAVESYGVKFEETLIKGTTEQGKGEVAQQGEAAPTKVDEREMKVLREGREAQINQELDLLESEKAAVVKEINQRQEEDKQPTKALQTKLDKINAEIEALLNEIELLPTRTREELASKIVAVKGQKISMLKNLAGVVAARLEKERLTEKFKREAADLKEARNELAKYVRDSFKGREVPKKFITRVNKVTPKTLEKFLAEVDQARLDIVRPALVNQINRILGRVAPKVQAGKAAGVLKSAALQDVANELIRISKIDAITARQLLRNKQQTLTNYFNQEGAENSVAGEVDVDRLNFEMEVIQNLAGLEGKTEEELMASLSYAQTKVALLRAGGKIRQEQLKQQREQERTQAISEMPKKGFTLIPQWLKSFSHFSTYNLSRMLDSLVGVKNVSESVLGKKIKALEEAPRKEASFNFLYNNGLEQVAKRVFGIKNEKEYSDWKNDRFKEGGGYDSGDNIEFNNGTTGRLLLAKADVAYWWLVTHDKNGNELPEMVEKFTGENARRALEEAAAESAEEAAVEAAALAEEMDVEVDGDVDVEAAPIQVDLSQIKGNAIPLAHWQEMMVNFESDQRNIEFVQSQRAFYNTVYSLINPVYRLYMGTDLPRVEDYIPWYRDVGAETEVFSALEDFMDLVQTTPRSTKLRTPGATAAFRQVGDIEVFQYFITEMAHFNAFALPMKDLISIIRNKEVRAAINKQTGGVELSGGQFKDSDSYKNLRRMADYIMSRGRSMNEFSLGLFNTMRSNVSIAYLGEPSKGIMQTSSMWMALAEPDITWGDWAVAFKEFLDSPAETIKLLESAPMMKFRYRDLMIEMLNAIEHIKTKDKTVGGRLRRFITPKAFYMVRFGNKVGAGISGYVVFRKVFNETGNIHEAFRRFDKHIVDTQQSAIATELSPFQIGQGNRIISQFQSAVIQYMRIYTRSWGDVFAGRITVQKFVDSMLVFHVLMPAMRWMLKALIRGGDFDPDELKKDVIIGPLTAGFIIPDILEGIISMAVNAHHFGASSALQTSADKVVKTAERIKKQLTKVLANDYYDAADLWYDGIELVEEVSTISFPIPGITYDAMQAAIKASQGEMTPMEILSVILGESVESLEFKNKGSNNTSGSLFRR